MQSKSQIGEEKLDVMGCLEEGEQIADICQYFRFIHSICAVCYNDDRIKESAKSGTKVFI